MTLPENIYVLLLLTLCVQAFVDLVLPYNPSKTRPIFWRLAVMLAEFFETKLDRERRSMVTRSLRGAFFLGFLLALGFGLGWAADFIVSILPVLEDGVVFVSFCFCLGFVKYVKTHTRIWRLVQETPPERAVIVRLFQDVFLPVPRISKEMAPYLRGGVISVGYHMTALLIGPLFWFFVLGYGGMFSYCLIMAAAMTVTRKEDFDFGWSVRMTARILDLLPGYLTAILLFMASWATIGTKPILALKSLFRHFPATLSHGILVVQSVMAGAVGGVLGGWPQHWYIDKDVTDLWLGGKEDSARLRFTQLRAAIRMSVIAYFILCALVALLFLGNRVPTWIL